MLKKILIFSTEYFPRVGGAEIAIKEITDRLPGYSFDMITAKGADNLPLKERIGNVMVYRAGPGTRFDKFLLPVTGFFCARRLSVRNEYAFVWSVMASYAGLAAGMFKFISKKKMVLTVQEGDDEEHLKRFVFGLDWLYKIIIRPVHRSVFKAADRITAISNDLALRALRSGSRREPIVIPNGVNTELFKRRADASPSFKERVGAKQNDRLVITVSRLAKKNGVSDLIKAFKIVSDSVGGVKLVICGTGEEEPDLKKTVEKLGLGERVRFAGLVKHEDLPPYLWASDCFVRPSLSEGLGNVFLEAMAAGVPIIGTPVGGIPDFLFDHETGLFCEPGNPQDIADKILKILDSPGLGAKLAANGLKLVCERFEWDAIAVKMGEVFEMM